MAQLGGGGNCQNAGARIENMELEQLEEILKNSIVYGIPAAEDTKKDNQAEDTPKKLIKKEEKL